MWKPPRGLPLPWRWIAVGGVVGGVLTLGTLYARLPALQGGVAASGPPPEILRLTRPPHWRERSVTTNEAHPYTVELKAGEFAEVVVDQRGQDVALVLEDPWDHPKIPLILDSPNGDWGPERVFLWAEKAVVFRLTVQPLGTVTGGRYAISVVEQRPARPEDAARAEAHLLDGRIARYLENSTSAEVLRAAADLGPKVLALWQTAGDKAGRLRTLQRLGDLHGGLFREYAQAEIYLREALSLAVELGEAVTEGRLCNSLGGTLDPHTRGEEREALYHRALRIGESRQGSEERTGWRIAAAAQHNLGYLYERQGQFYRSISANRQAEVLWRRTGDEELLLGTLQALGRNYLLLHREESAREVLEETVALADREGTPLDRARAWRRLGQARLVLRDLPGALEALNTAYRWSQKTRTPSDDAHTLYLLGEVRRLMGDLDLAEGRLREALALYEGNAEGTAITWSHLVRVAEDRGDVEGALEASARAEAALPEGSDPRYLATVRWVRARALRRGGDLPGALARIESALDLVERERLSVSGEENRAQILSFRHEYFDFAVDLLLEMDRKMPGQGYRERAFEIVERGRARNLLDTMRVAPDGRVRQGARTAALRAEAGELWRRIGQEDLLRAVGRGQRSEPEWQAMLERYRLLVAEIRVQEGRIEDRPLARRGFFQEIQGLLDPDTRLLSFSLAAPHSLLWVAGPDSLRSYTLPGIQEIDAQARYVGGLLGQNEPVQTLDALRAPLRRLSDMLLKEAMAELDGVRRLVIIGDGALHSLPFAALPRPETAGSNGAEWRYLLEDFDLVSLPSGLVLTELAKKRRPWRPGSLSVAVVSDAVYQRHDPRFSPALRAPAAEFRGAPTEVQLAAELGLGRLDRLRAAEQEAKAILGHFPAGRRSLFSGFEARRETVLGGALHDFDIVHLIAHGEINAEHPELSRLVFSVFDRAGNPVDGFVRAHEIYGLDWRARLVVLSACDTALGKEIRGEGLVGLTQGFFSIGASRVVVSLWAVNDTATAELMGQLYREMLERGLEPAAALRQAQLHLLRQDRWAAPYYWAPFVLQGDWR